MRRRRGLKSRSSCKSSSNGSRLRRPACGSEYTLKRATSEDILPLGWVVRRVELPHERIELLTSAAGAIVHSYGPAQPSRVGPKREDHVAVDMPSDSASVEALCVHEGAQRTYDPTERKEYLPKWPGLMLYRSPHAGRRKRLPCRTRLATRT